MSLLHKRVLNVGLVGPGLVGKSFLDQISNSPQLEVIAIINSTKMGLSSSGKLDMDANMDDFITFCQENAPCVIVDCTSSQSIANSYPAWLKKNLSIITPNKKAFSSSIELFTEIMNLTSEKWPRIYHESSVGAGLPLLSTIQDFIQTGDRIERISGVLSGTLSYIFNTFSSASNTLEFSEIVEEARSKGYTEPDPREDLNGLDVARKVVILARLTGQNIELEDVTVENIVPPALMRVSMDEFSSQLPSYDQDFKAKLMDAKQKGKVLRYVGIVERGRNRVELQAVCLNHSFAALYGSDNIIQIKSTRFPNGLVVQGAGAGDQVTAFGIHSDLLKIYREL